MASACTIIGVGNPDRGDDGIGRAVAEQLRAQVGGGIEVAALDGEVTALLDCLERAQAAYLIDAVSSGAPPGTVHRFDVAAEPLPSISFAASTHGLGLAEAIELARAMRSLPSTCVVYGIEAASFEDGQPLSPAVSAASGRVTKRILAELGERHA
jgi:hydrogenase maturation protease